MSDEIDLLLDLDRQPAAAPEEPKRIDLAAQDEAARADPALFERVAEEPPFARGVLTTPLHLNVAVESRTNLWTHWNGYTTPDVLTNLEDEYRALRHAAALSDVSPLVKYRITGADAAAYLARLVTGTLVSLSVNEIAPVVLCEDRGFVVGDGTLFRLGDSEYRLVTEERHLAWLLDSSIGMRVRVEDVTATLAALSLQGPLSASVLAEAGFSGIEALRPYTARWFDAAGMPVYVSRTGNSGDLGYELWIDPEDAPALWIRLLEKGAPFSLAAGGFALRELARVEAGLPRAGVDYLGAFAAVDPANASTPFELGFASQVDLESGHFTGRDALRAGRLTPPRHILAALAIDWHEPLRFSAIRGAGGIVGLATSIAFSPSLGLNLALATLKPSAIAADAGLYVEAEIRRELDLSLLKAPARIVSGPALALPARHLVPAPITFGL
ncbi:MAG: aminomethyltransferase family protein [Parvibaculum sp.]|uniref:aminomethyltransferase family protein n=1 Tax=Parvibaculum sp. TaxID=2024848 RepID=UPI0025E7EE7A|nr:aminomethyltransferase family protein [Parvibaculum sp.]MCE9650536.1 aminomethyltransferase family protein [Parvibaculum sp.]